MANQKKACEEDLPVRRQMPEPYYPLVSLLHTLREMQAHEEQICTLLTDLQRAGKMTPAIRRELSAFMTSFPAASLRQDVEELSMSLFQ